MLKLNTSIIRETSVKDEKMERGLSMIEQSDSRGQSRFAGAKVSRVPVKKWTNELEKRRDAIGLERDKLRDMLSDVMDLEEACEEAYNSLNDAIDKLSELA
jgi:hypothetical protein